MKFLLSLILLFSCFSSFCQPAAHSRLMERMNQGVRTSYKTNPGKEQVVDILMDTVEMKVWTIRLHVYTDSSEYFAEKMVVIRKEDTSYRILQDRTVLPLAASDLEWKVVYTGPGANKVCIRLLNNGKRQVHWIITRMKGY